MKKVIVIVLWILIIFSTIMLVCVITAEENNLVIDVIDGDTLRLNGGDTVRLLSIDAPEKGYDYYSESREKLAELVKGKQVYLEKDKSERDRYDRLLRYVYVDDVFVNLVMVEEGYAVVKIYDPDVRYEEKLKQAERIARVLEIGVWGKTTENICCTALGCDEQAQFVGSANSNKYHSCCSTFARMISKDNLVCFRSRNEAIIKGYEAGDV